MVLNSHNNCSWGWCLKQMTTFTQGDHIPSLSGTSSVDISCLGIITIDSFPLESVPVWIANYINTEPLTNSWVISITTTSQRIWAWIYCIQALLRTLLQLNDIFNNLVGMVISVLLYLACLLVIWLEMHKAVNSNHVTSAPTATHHFRRPVTSAPTESHHFRRPHLNLGIWKFLRYSFKNKPAGYIYSACFCGH